MVILGLDPGSRKIGYALLEIADRKIFYITSGTFEMKQKDFLERVPQIFSQTSELLMQYRPQEVALESLIFAKNPSSLFKLAQARGVLLAAVSQIHRDHLYEYSPTQIKSAVTGHGHADKAQILKFFRHTLGIQDFSGHDETDALAVAFTHALLRNRFLFSTKPKSKGGLAQHLQHKISEAL